MKEIWKDIPDTRLYQVSNLGRVRSWIKPGPYEGFEPDRSDNPRVLKTCLDKHGFRKVVVSIEACRSSCYVHLLVLEAFVRYRKNSELAVFKDGDRGHCALSNLSYAQIRDIRKYTGVYKRGLKWRARVRVSGKLRHLGTFESKSEALKSRAEFLENHNG